MIYTIFHYIYLKNKRGNYFMKFVISLTRGLFETLDGFLQIAYHRFWLIRYKVFRFYHINSSHQCFHWETQFSDPCFRLPNVIVFHGFFFLSITFIHFWELQLYRACWKSIGSSSIMPISSWCSWRNII